MVQNMSCKIYMDHAATTEMLPQVRKAIEPYIMENGTTFLLMRNGYFTLDTKSSGSVPVFNRVVSLKSSFKLQ